MFTKIFWATMFLLVISVSSAWALTIIDPEVGSSIQFMENVDGTDVFATETSRWFLDVTLIR